MPDRSVDQKSVVAFGSKDRGFTLGLLYTPVSYPPTMPKAYKITSDPFFVNGNLTQSAIDTYTELEISMPLDSLNQEGIVVHAVYWTGSTPSLAPAVESQVQMQLTALPAKPR